MDIEEKQYINNNLYTYVSSGEIMSLTGINIKDRDQLSRLDFQKLMTRLVSKGKNIQ